MSKYLHLIKLIRIILFLNINIPQKIYTFNIKLKFVFYVHDDESYWLK